MFSFAPLITPNAPQRQPETVAAVLGLVAYGPEPQSRERRCGAAHFEEIYAAGGGQPANCFRPRLPDLKVPSGERTPPRNARGYQFEPDVVARVQAGWPALAGPLRFPAIVE